ncbi:MAG TPA: hypothetical protein DCR93_34225, partial [Cytophagales bacterium]|nr:hypothetical protein [Cytophagales bacterium]
GEDILTKTSEQSSSVKTARLNMIRELVEFMENSLPELIGNVIGLVGVIAIIATLNIKVFVGCLICTVVISLIYLLTSRRTVRLNRSYNDELEKQVDVVASEDPVQLHEHLKSVMKWNIKLSDLEAGNFSFSWLILVVFLLLSVLIPIQDGVVQYGALFALVMYAFEYIEYVLGLPLFYQHWLRLSEIRERLNEW